MIGSLALGGAVAVLVFTQRDRFVSWFSALETDMSEKLRRLRASRTHLRKYLVAWLVAVGCCFLAFSFVLGSLIFAVLLSGLLVCGPWYILRRMAEIRRQKIEDQLADAMVGLANAVKAGLSLPQALDILASQCPKPINTEFHQIVAEYNMGKPLEQTLTEAKERLRSENFALFAASLMASHESGGKLNETVERIAQSVLELQRLERKVASETAQARKSAVYMAMVPPVILLMYMFVEPQNTPKLFTTVPGQMILASALVLNVVAYFWARVILNPDI